eukprot:11250407-Ditylum_brightwellii.AAC.1
MKRQMSTVVSSSHQNEKQSTLSAQKEIARRIASLVVVMVMKGGPHSCALMMNRRSISNFHRLINQ